VQDVQPAAWDAWDALESLQLHFRYEWGPALIDGKRQQT
jgi:hypothetical protein